MSKTKFRVFVSYSHYRSEMALTIVKYLNRIGFDAQCDRSLQAGSPFTDEIKEQISRVHLFVPLLTKDIQCRPWVNQEIGYAMGMRVPVLPLALGTLPDGMSQSLQAIEIDPKVSWKDKKSRKRGTSSKELAKELDKCLPPEIIMSLIDRWRHEPTANFEWVDFLEPRTEIIVRAARWVLTRKGPVIVRQAAVLGSFSLPNARPHARIWKRIEGKHKSGEYARYLFAKEFRVLRKHVRKAGCKLLLHPLFGFETNGIKVTVRRIKVLVRFLREMSDSISRNQCQIVIVDTRPRSNSSDPLSKRRVNREFPKLRNLLILGDWFEVESGTRLPGVGYQQSIATWHALTVMTRIEEFDARFEKLRKYHLSPAEAADELDRICAEIDPAI